MSNTNPISRLAMTVFDDEEVHGVLRSVRFPEKACDKDSDLDVNVYEMLHGHGHKRPDEVAEIQDRDGDGKADVVIEACTGKERAVTKMDKSRFEQAKLIWKKTQRLLKGPMVLSEDLPDELEIPNIAPYGRDSIYRLGRKRAWLVISDSDADGQADESIIYYVTKKKSIAIAVPLSLLTGAQHLFEKHNEYMSKILDEFLEVEEEEYY